MNLKLRIKNALTLRSKRQNLTNPTNFDRFPTNKANILIDVKTFVEFLFCACLFWKEKVLFQAQYYTYHFNAMHNSIKTSG